MKNSVLYSLLIMLFCGISCSAEEKPITFEVLPMSIQTQLRQSFPVDSILLVTADGKKEYKITFLNHTQVEFTGKGIVKEVECLSGKVPDNCVPVSILSFVSTKFPDAQIVKYEWDISDKEYEVRLSNRTELTFNKSFGLIKSTIYENDD